jgi:hypothetical protein
MIMSIDRSDMDDGARASARQLLARAAAAPGHAQRRLAAAIDDFFIPDDARLDDRMHATLAATLAALVDAVERDIRRQTARLLAGATRHDLADKVAAGDAVLDRLIDAGLMRDVDLLREVIGRARQDLLADMLPVAAPDEAGAPGLLARLSGSGDGAVAAAALALMAVDSRRRGFLDTNRLSQTELPAELHHRLVWWVAAAIREQQGASEADPAIAEAAMRALANHDEGDRVESVAMKLAGAIDAQAAELPALLTHALGERQVALFIALIGRALGVDYPTARDLVVDGAGERLWLALRAIELDRPTIARVGLSLCEADPRGDVHVFADKLDAIVAVTPDEARAALATLRLHADFRAALAALGGPK